MHQKNVETIRINAYGTFDGMVVTTPKPDKQSGFCTGGGSVQGVF
jgi:hypothetical protein